MRFLIDAQLPPALARWLAEQGHEASHLLDHGALGSSDRAVWELAQRLGAIIVSKDEDFVHLRTLRAEGPALIWVRIGNTSRRALPSWFAALLPHIERALRNGEVLVELSSQDGG